MARKLNQNFIGSSILLIAQYLNQIIGPLVNLLVIRYLGENTFGLYASAIAVTSFFTILPDFGVQQAALHLLSKKEYNPKVILKDSFKISFVYALIAYIIVVLWFLVLNYDFITQVIGIIVGFTFFRISILTNLVTFLQYHSNYSKIGLYNFLISLSQWLSTLVGIILNVDIFTLVSVPIVSSTILTVILFCLERKKIKLNTSIQNCSTTTKILLQNSWQFGLAGSMHQLYHKSDAVILSLFRAPFEVGQYTLAFKILELIYFFPGVLFNQILYPKYFNWSKGYINKLKLYYSLMNKIMIVLGIIITFILCLYSNYLLSFFFGNNINQSAVCLVIMSFAIPLRFWASSIGAVLTTDGYIKHKLKLQTIVAFMNVSLNFFLIPKFGAYIAALLMVLTDLILLIGYLLVLHKFNERFSTIKVCKRSIFVIISILFLSFFIYFIARNSIILIKFLFTVIYILISLGLMGVWFTKEEISELKRFLNNSHNSL